MMFRIGTVMPVPGSIYCVSLVVVVIPSIEFMNKTMVLK